MEEYEKPLRFRRDDSPEEFKPLDTTLRDYRDIIGEIPEDTVSPTNSFITPKECDYEKGYFKRFFVARYDSSEATEVTAEFFANEFSKLPKGLYTGTSIIWYITQKNLPVIRSVLKELTAENINENNVFAEVRDFPQIENTLKDFSQFVR